ncbi:GNAT family N-acetyltransferase [Rudanella paleaurantiibacter]|uniref:GNAT family N-acetyltransferase n=1 Tax=Rudanella paleaurantiibacter TaxID=2614655 RepID=A0A7J5TUK5_9BACT|nr:GNAT family protein [Rudanella paleaurantiibacter]KAB7727339.1 GNAT family N-acetyltransferase [Rudanella paleaurantiibacter]
MQLECGLCRVRSWQFGDEVNLHTHANNRAIWLNLRDSFPFPYTPTDAQRWIQYVVDPAVELNFALDVGGEAVGNIGLRFGDDIDRYSAEIWYWLGEAHWGKGIITAALRAFTDYAFVQYPLTRLYAMPYAHNLGSIKVLEKARFQREGVLRSSAVKDGIVLDKVLYAYLSSDWLNAPANGHES